jgi:hypothetical protein
LISPVELQALCSLVGPHGINYLIQELIYEKGILTELKATKQALMEAPAARPAVGGGGKVNVETVLTRGIRIGCLMAIRNQIWDAMNTGK